MLTIAECFARDNAAGAPCHYYGESGDWLNVGIGQSRDSDALERANFQAACAAFVELDDACYRVERFSHWAVGWTETILVDPSNASDVALADELRARLEDYPVLDDEKYSEIETEEAEENWRDWARSNAANDFTRELVDDFSARLGAVAEEFDVEWYVDLLDLTPALDASRWEGNYFNAEEIDTVGIVRHAVAQFADELFADVLDPIVDELTTRMRCGDAAARAAILDVTAEGSDAYIEAYYFARD